MKRLLFGLSTAMVLALVSCGPGNNEEDKQGHSTPIDSVNDNGTAPATYQADNPANIHDTVMVNANDTGTTVNEGPETTR